MANNTHFSEKDKGSVNDDDDDFVELPKGEEEVIKKCNVFISYQWKAQLKVKQLYDELASIEALDIFIDVYRIRAGMNLYLTLASSLQEADVVLACVTREYVNSKNCEREIIYADSFNKQIIPLYLEKIPIKELGSIGFILVRERYVNLYKNQTLFENLKESDELKDIFDGISSISLKSKGFKIDLLKKKSVEIKSLDEFLKENVDSEVLRFRNDQPFNADLNPNPPPPIKKAEAPKMISNAAPPPIESDKKLFGSTARAFGAIQSLHKNTLAKSIDAKSARSSNSQSKVVLNPLEMHPVIKECNYLYVPKSVLHPLADKIYIEDSVERRGGMAYLKAFGWIRYALKIEGCYPNTKTWLAKDGNAFEWAVAYIGFKTSPPRQLKKRLFDSTGKLNPTIERSKQTNFANMVDVNPKSRRYGEKCDTGIICTPNPAEAEKHTVEFLVESKKYKMILQCRVNPHRVRMPKGAKDLYIINSEKNIRPYGVMLKEIN